MHARRCAPTATHSAPRAAPRRASQVPIGPFRDGKWTSATAAGSEARAQPVRIVDPLSGTTFALLRAGVFCGDRPPPSISVTDRAKKN
jgi:hypothetical protein